MEFHYTLQTGLTEVEEIEYVSVKDVTVTIKSYIPSFNTTLATVTILASFKTDLGQCGGVALNECITETEKFIFNNVNFIGEATDIKADKITSTYTIDKATGDLKGNSDIEFILSY